MVYIYWKGVDKEVNYIRLFLLIFQKSLFGLIDNWDVDERIVKLLVLFKCLMTEFAQRLFFFFLSRKNLLHQGLQKNTKSTIFEEIIQRILTFLLKKYLFPKKVQKFHWHPKLFKVWKFAQNFWLSSIYFHFSKVILAPHYATDKFEKKKQQCISFSSYAFLKLFI